MKTKHLALALAAALACPTLVHAQQAEGARATATDDTPESDARRVETPDPQLPTVTVVGVRVIPLPRADAVRADAALAAGAAASSDTAQLLRGIPGLSLQAGGGVSSGSGRPWPTSQNGQRRVHLSPMIMNVAVPLPKHSPMFGHEASSHTECSLCSPMIHSCVG